MPLIPKKLSHGIRDSVVSVRRSFPQFFIKVAPSDVFGTDEELLNRDSLLRDFKLSNEDIKINFDKILQASNEVRGALYVAIEVFKGNSMFRMLLDPTNHATNQFYHTKFSTGTTQYHMVPTTKVPKKFTGSENRIPR